MALQLPARIGKYDLEEFLGGGMSHVYRARDTVIGRTVAVKILTEAGCADVEAKARFLQEARMAGNIQHDNVLSIYDFGEDDQHRPFMVMEFLRGEDLRHAIRNDHVGDLRNRLRIAMQVARAIGFIHSQKIIHRDIKPENIHLTQNGVVKLMDFGIAKTEGLSMTRTGYVMGTPFYMAPEQVLGKNITEKVDIYAFGVLFFELLAGVRPVSGDTVERIFYSILNEPLNLEPLAPIGVPPAICDLIARCTAKDPAQRPENFEVVAQEIEGILGQMASGSAAPATAGTAETTEPAPAPSVFKPWMAVALGVALVAVIAVGAMLFLHRAPAPEPGKKAAAALSATLALPSGDMVLIPAGPFQFGDPKSPATVNLPAYYIDRTEVTNAAYKSFSQATSHALPKGFPPDKPDYPVVNITIDDARQFARWAGKRLPTSQEWEKAARGTDGRLYPWGAEADPTRANVKNNPALHEHQLMPANGFENGASSYHVLQMVGNAWEFVDEPGHPSARIVAYYSEMLGHPLRADEAWYLERGGFYGLDLDSSLLWDTGPIPALYKADGTGFRCVKDAH